MNQFKKMTVIKQSIIIISMFQSDAYQLCQKDEQKLNVITPSNIQSIHSLEQQHNISSEDQFYDFGNQQAIFNLLEEKEQDIYQQQQIKQHKTFHNYQDKESFFTIEIIIKTTTASIIKSFSKTIIKSVESKNSCKTLIFDRQHEKLKLEENQNYIIEFLLVCHDGFYRKICSQNFIIPNNLNNWSVFTLYLSQKQQNTICLNIQTQKLNYLYIKPLSLTISTKIVDNFFQLKYKLLHKSDLLNELQTITQLKGLLLILSKQNMGSRIIQKLLTWANQQQVQNVINQLNNSFIQMVYDRFGNYVFQKIYKVANQNQQNYCFQKLQPELINLLQTKQGTHSIQTLVDNMNPQQIRSKFTHFTHEQIILLSTNKFGMYFIQKILPYTAQQYLKQILLNNFNILSTNKQGIVLLKSFMNYSLSHQETRYQILIACQNWIHQISFTQFGHYIIEEMKKYYTFQQLQNILNYIVNYSFQFSQNQYSSSILRKFIDAFGDYISIPIIQVILQNGLPEMMENSSGEFILHRLMEQTINQYYHHLLINQMIILCKNVKCYEKRQKWLKFFKLI